MSDREMTTIVLNALPDEWGNFVSSIYGKKEFALFSELCSLCKIELTRLNAKREVASNEQVQAYVVMARRKRKYWKVVSSEEEEEDRYVKKTVL